VRVGSTLRKEAGPWTPTIQALLRFLRDADFDLAPEPLGLDDRGREVMSWLEGTSATKPWPAHLVRDEGVMVLASALRRYHDVVAGFDPGPDACWRVGCRGLRPGEIVCHGDLALWNTVWRLEELVGIIDWDMAEPGLPLHDVAFLALHLVPLHSDEWASATGFDDPPPRAERLGLLCETYGGIRPDEVIHAVQVRLERERIRTVEWGREGREPWATFLAQGDLAKVDEDATWLHEHAADLFTSSDNM